MAFPIACQRMQSPSRRLQVGRRFGRIKSVKLNGEFGGMSRLNSCFASGLEESLNSGVPKALDHALSVAPHAHPVKPLMPAIRRFLDVTGDGCPRSGFSDLGCHKIITTATGSADCRPLVHPRHGYAASTISMRSRLPTARAMVSRCTALLSGSSKRSNCERLVPLLRHGLFADLARFHRFHQLPCDHSLDGHGLYLVENALFFKKAVEGGTAMVEWSVHFSPFSCLRIFCRARSRSDATEALCGLDVSKSQVSALTKTLDAEAAEWRMRPLIALLKTLPRIQYDYNQVHTLWIRWCPEGELNPHDLAVCGF